MGAPNKVMEDIYTIDKLFKILSDLMNSGVGIYCVKDMHTVETGILLRHDIDNEIESALEVAKMEFNLDIQSTFYFRVAAQFYNIFSQEGGRIINSIRMMGHEIGLHFDPSIYKDIEAGFWCELRIMEDVIGENVLSTSLHEPNAYGKYPKFPGIISAYDEKVFSKETYFSDSRFGFNVTTEEIIEKARRSLVQVLFHPTMYCIRNENESPNYTHIYKTISKRFGSAVQVKYERIERLDILVMVDEPIKRLGMYNSRLHVGFLMGLQEFGHRVQVVSIDMGIKKMVAKHKPDILLIYNSTGVNSHQVRDVNCCKVLIEVDLVITFNRESRGPEWFGECGFDLVILRGALNPKTEQEMGAPTTWLPFSASTEEFYPDLSLKKEPVVSFLAQSSGMDLELYSGVVDQRVLAMKKLTEAGIYKGYHSIGEYRNNRKSAYSDVLRSSLLFLTTTEIASNTSTASPKAKMFEAMASGAVVLTPSFLGEKSLFGEKECYIKYDSDCSDIVEQAKKALNDPKRLETIRDNAFNVFLRFHTHKKRLRELNQHLQDVFHGYKVTSHWGIGPELEWWNQRVKDGKACQDYRR